ncbi:PAS and ANTAR domain-containing protein [Nocardia sp. BMG111209]|uniref:PAS and ANTAR domain-containing protein n=1 Tax=Nocardia sp. BMG111209 TaxID=1160137 RepID=UPI0012DDC081|nr:PAS and ANTAR domain-containing protein [Nocardia sp. BMG111209]
MTPSDGRAAISAGDRTADPAGDAHAPIPVAGRFRFWFESQRWEWSPEVFRMHGYPPDAVQPTTALLLAHKHPDDRDHVAAAITRSATRAVPFSSRHRVVDTAGRVHTVMVVADLIIDADGQAIGTEGFYVDLGTVVADTARELFDTRLPEIIRTRAEIEQAKGVLMTMYRIGADQAFEVLRWRSQETNIKWQLLAARLLGDLLEVPRVPAEVITAFDHLLLTAHLRVPPDPPAGDPDPRGDD